MVFDRFVVLAPIRRPAGPDTWSGTDVPTQQRAEMEIYPAVPLNVPAWTDSLKRAATTASQLHHPHVTRLLDLRVTPQFTAAIWQNSGGERTLADELAQQPQRRFPFAAAARWLEQLAAALDFIHSHQTAHGALSLRRLSLTADGQLVLSHACVFNALREIALQCGTAWDAQDELPLLSPQRWDGAMVTPADDVYAFGGLAYWMLTGLPPFHEGDIAQQSRESPVTPIFLQTTPTGASIEDVPPGWQAFISACLAKHPTQRPTGLLNALRAAQPAPVVAPPPAPFASVTPPLPAAPEAGFSMPAVTAPPPPVPPTPPVPAPAAPVVYAPPPVPAPVFSPPAPPAPAIHTLPTPPAAAPPPPPPAPAPVTAAPILPTAPAAAVPTPVGEEQPDITEDAPTPAPPRTTKPAPAKKIEPVPASSNAKAPAVEEPKPAEKFDPYSRAHKKSPAGKPWLPFAAAGIAIALALGGYFWRDASIKNAVRAEIARKVAQADELAAADNESAAVQVLKDAQALAPQDTTIQDRIRSIEERALNRQFAAYLAELKANGRIERAAEADQLIAQTLIRDASNEPARALRLAIETARQKAEAAAKIAQQAEEARLAEQARLARLKDQESAAAKAEADAARRAMRIAQLKLQVLQADHVDKAPAARQALDELTLLVPTDAELPGLNARLVALTTPKPAPVEEKAAAPIASPTANTTPKVADVRVAAKLLRRNPPIYPPAMLRARRAGIVELSFTVEADGRVGDVEVLRATNKEFADAAVRAVKDYKFQPATLNGKPVAQRVQAPIEFNP